VPNPVPASVPLKYLDAASGSPLHPVAREALLAALEDGWADPGRLHSPGRRARLLLDAARDAVAEVIGARPDEVSFTTGTAQSLQLAIEGATLGPRRTTTLVHSAVEHSAVLHAAARHRDGGGTTVSVGVDHVGRVSTDSFVSAVYEHHAAAAVLQMANHEVGTVQPVTAVSAALDEVALIVDGAVSVGHAPIAEGWSILTGDARGWGGPGGVGLLAVRAGTRWSAPIPADGYEYGRVGGVPNVASIVAAAASLRAVEAEREETASRHRHLIDRIRHAVAASVPDVEVLGDPDDRLPHLVTFSCLYVDGEALLSELDRRGFAVSSGSSCTSSTLEPSHVLAAMGALTSGNIRISLGGDTASDDIDAFLAVLPGAVATVRAELGAAGL
jgi:cysteine desulfurase